MNKQQIKAELRRSACEDEKPFRDVAYCVFRICADKYRDDNNYMHEFSDTELRIFFLLVAEAL